MLPAEWFVARGLVFACGLVFFFCELVSFLVFGFYDVLLTFSVG